MYKYTQSPSTKTSCDFYPPQKKYTVYVSEREKKTDRKKK